jgi:hypothetical protein
MADRLSGKASYLNVNGTLLPITKTSAKVNRACKDSTDSGDYYASPDMIYPTQIPVSVQTVISVEGNYRFSSTPSAIIALLYTDATQIPCVLGLNTGAVVGHGFVDVTDFETSLPLQDIVTWTATLTSNGQWFPNA